MRTKEQVTRAHEAEHVSSACAIKKSPGQSNMQRQASPAVLDSELCQDDSQGHIAAQGDEHNDGNPHL